MLNLKGFQEKLLTFENLQYVISYHESYGVFVNGSCIKVIMKGRKLFGKRSKIKYTDIWNMLSNLSITNIIFVLMSLHFEKTPEKITCFIRHSKVSLGTSLREIYLLWVFKIRLVSLIFSDKLTKKDCQRLYACFGRE
ncbi:hypothetical protein PRUPE_7G000500 [Prunus persica]|uniref:Uncharacterized protein n=1 Tax=Prunus persica TaxID=3760 RepID=A0A251N473_PRUPE|nr:hypothetical protein PRUPE_7G000500 [Prunus persica]